jgi:PTH1 family peptidyl-tRNA hydrolase
VGLGNPGAQYGNTRHNAGFLALDAIAEKLGVRIERTRFKALTAEATLGGAHVLLMKPQTFMNLSGEAVREAAAFYKIAPEKIIVVCDDVNFEVGKLRVRRDGTDGGQKGVRDIIYQMSSDKFPRIKVGVGKKPHPDMPMADWVLSRFTDKEIEELKNALELAADGVRMIVNGKIDDAMQHCNSK